MRDRTKYLYVTVGIPLHSEELTSLQTEAASYDVSLARMISMLLIDRHAALQGKGQGIWFPRGHMVAATPQIRVEEPAVSLTDTVKMRAIAAASAWDEE